MSRALIFVFLSAFLLQLVGKVIIMSNYQLNKVRITQLFCINKSKPQLHCNGKCHLQKELSKEDEKENGSAKHTQYKEDILFHKQTNKNGLMPTCINLTNMPLQYNPSLLDGFLSDSFRPPSA